MWKTKNWKLCWQVFVKKILNQLIRIKHSIRLLVYKASQTSLSMAKWEKAGAVISFCMVYYQMSATQQNAAQPSLPQPAWTCITYKMRNTIFIFYFQCTSIHLTKLVWQDDFKIVSTWGVNLDVLIRGLCPILPAWINVIQFEEEKFLLDAHSQGGRKNSGTDDINWVMWIHVWFLNVLAGRESVFFRS